jgi:lysyl-tRNA synthetase class 2
MSIDWQPGASVAALRRRAGLFATLRRFFAERGVIEVDTPLMAAGASVDRHIESFEVAHGGWLQTSPEFHMKRLLAAGSGPIYQLGHVFRREQRTRRHRPEFMMLEWYRPGWDDRRLITEVLELLQVCGAPAGGECLRYEDAFQRYAQIDAFADADVLAACARERGLAPQHVDADDAADADFWRDLIMSLQVQPALGADAPCAVTDFPASQAALAKLRSDDPRCAARFEIYWQGVELANGFQELTDAAEQRRRFEADRAWRSARSLSMPPIDEALLAALTAGMPESAGVAMGVDRLLMLLLGEPSLDAVMPF